MPSTALIQILLVTEFLTLGQKLNISLTLPYFMYVFQLLFIPSFLSSMSLSQTNMPQGPSYLWALIYLSPSAATNNFLALSFCFLLQED